MVLGRMTEDAHTERFLLDCFKFLFVTTVGLILLCSHTYAQTHIHTENKDKYKNTDGYRDMQRNLYIDIE